MLRPEGPSWKAGTGAGSPGGLWQETLTSGVHKPWDSAMEGEGVSGWWQGWQAGGNLRRTGGMTMALGVGWGHRWTKTRGGVSRVPRACLQAQTPSPSPRLPGPSASAPPVPRPKPLVPLLAGLLGTRFSQVPVGHMWPARTGRSRLSFVAVLVLRSLPR